MIKILFILFCSTIYFNAQQKDTVEHYNLSLHRDKHNRLFKVINSQTNKEFNGWGWYDNGDSKIYKYYQNNKLIYTDIRNLDDKIIRREYFCNNYTYCIEVHEFYNNNTSLIHKKYFIQLFFDDDYKTTEKKNGKYFEYDINGKVKTQGQYKNDRKTGKWLHFDENGAIL